MLFHEAIPALREGKLAQRQNNQGTLVVGLRTWTIQEERGCPSGRRGVKVVCEGCEYNPCYFTRKKEAFLKVEMSPNGHFMSLHDGFSPEDLLEQWEVVPEDSPLIQTYRDFLDGWKARLEMP